MKICTMYVVNVSIFIVQSAATDNLIRNLCTLAGVGNPFKVAQCLVTNGYGGILVVLCGCLILIYSPSDLNTLTIGCVATENVLQFLFHALAPRSTCGSLSDTVLLSVKYMKISSESFVSMCVVMV